LKQKEKNDTAKIQQDYEARMDKNDEEAVRNLGKKNK